MPLQGKERRQSCPSVVSRSLWSVGVGGREAKAGSSQFSQTLPQLGAQRRRKPDRCPFLSRKLSRCSWKTPSRMKKWPGGCASSPPCYRSPLPVAGGSGPFGSLEQSAAGARARASCLVSFSTRPEWTATSAAASPILPAPRLGTGYCRLALRRSPYTATLTTT